MIDDVDAHYSEAQQSWLVENLVVECSTIDDDLHYALSELLIVQCAFDGLELENEINRIYKACSGQNVAYVVNYIRNI
jgi:hypothetical protein